MVRDFTRFRQEISRDFSKVGHKGECEVVNCLMRKQAKRPFKGFLLSVLGYVSHTSCHNATANQLPRTSQRELQKNSLALQNSQLSMRWIFGLIQQKLVCIGPLSRPRDHYRGECIEMEGGNGRMGAIKASTVAQTQCIHLAVACCLEYSCFWLSRRMPSKCSEPGEVLRAKKRA